MEEDLISYSQLGQEEFVLNTLKHKRNGFFVEAGANDGISLSNTFLLEKKYGWTGICVEPGSQFELLTKNRSCQCVNVALWKKEELIPFVEDSINSGMLSGHANCFDKRRPIGPTKIIQGIPLEHLLDNANAPHYIDYLSLDTEGTEWHIIEDFPFNKYKFGILTIEHNFIEPRRSQTRELLSQYGYRCIPSQWDDWFVSNHVI